MYASWEWIPLLLALGIALFLRPWRMLRRTELLTPRWPVSWVSLP